MATLKKYSINGKANGELSCNQELASAEAHGQMIKDYIVALRANARQWSACTKGRSEVKHTTKKPFQQKGSGNARQGSLVAPQFRGGGRVHGPKPKFDQHVRINKKERRAAIRALLAEKIRDNKVVIIESTHMDAPKTQAVARFLDQVDMNGRTLILGESTQQTIPGENSTQTVCVQSDKHNAFYKSARNIPGVQFQLANTISGYDILVAHNIVMTEAALREIEAWLCPQAN